MIITVVGLGVVGGSFVKALKGQGHEVYGVDVDKSVDPEAVADQLDDIVGTFYTYTLPAALVPMKMQKGGE